MVRPRRSERGFTLIEVMIVVVVVGLLAAVVVPSFIGEGRKVKASTEVAAMFAELMVKQEQYKLENGAYLAVPTCPATPSSKPQDITACQALPSWIALRILPPESKLKCSYTVTVGPAGTAPAAGAGFTLTTSAPATGWHYVHAKCDMDGNTSAYSEYLQSTLDMQIQKVNEGK